MNYTGHIEYPGGSDGTSSWDDFAAQPNNYWNWGERRGLSKCVKDPKSHEWKETIKQNTDMKDWTGVKMLFH